MCPPPQHRLSWGLQRAHQIQPWLTGGCGWWMRPGRTGGNRTHACMCPGPARTANRFASVMGRDPCASSWHLFDWPGRCEPPRSGPHSSHFWSAPAAASHSGTFWRMVSQPDFILLPLLMVHFIPVSHAMFEYGFPVMDQVELVLKGEWSGWTTTAQT